MDQYQSMAFANAFLSAKGQWGSEDEYYRRHDTGEDSPRAELADRFGRRAARRDLRRLRRALGISGEGYANVRVMMSRVSGERSGASAMRRSAASASARRPGSSAFHERKLMRSRAAVCGFRLSRSTTKPATKS